MLCNKASIAFSELANLAADIDLITVNTTQYIVYLQSFWCIIM